MVSDLIVVVDDDDANRIVAYEILSDAGFRVRTLPSTDGLRDLIAHERPSLVILDGSLTIAARAHVPRAMPVIVLSAAYGRDIERYATEIEAKAWLRKPFDVDELVSLVKEHATRD